MAADSRPFHEDQQEWAAPRQSLREKPSLFSEGNAEIGVWGVNSTWLVRTVTTALIGTPPYVLKYHRASVGAGCELLGLRNLISHRLSWCKWMQCYLWQARTFLQRVKLEEQETLLWSLSCQNSGKMSCDNLPRGVSLHELSAALLAHKGFHLPVPCQALIRVSKERVSKGVR